MEICNNLNVVNPNFVKQRVKTGWSALKPHILSDEKTMWSEWRCDPTKNYRGARSRRIRKYQGRTTDFLNAVRLLVSFELVKLVVVCSDRLNYSIMFFTRSQRSTKDTSRICL